MTTAADPGSPEARQESLHEALGAILPAGRVLTSAEDLAVYAFDGTALLHQLPACVVMPDTVEQIVGVLRVATELTNTSGIPIQNSSRITSTVSCAASASAVVDACGTGGPPTCESSLPPQAVRSEPSARVHAKTATVLSRRARSGRLSRERRGQPGSRATKLWLALWLG